MKKFVVEWCLDNLVPIKKSQQPNRNWHVITYEELVVKPEETIALLCRRLELPNPDRMLDRVTSPSKVTDTSTTRTLQKIRQGDRQHLITKWRDAVDRSQEEKLFRIVEKFDITMYAPGRFMPNKAWLNAQTGSP